MLANSTYGPFLTRPSDQTRFEQRRCRGRRWLMHRAEHTQTIFISYSRDDVADTRRPARRRARPAALRSGDQPPQDERAGEEFPASLGGLIRDADAVVFVLSPASAASDMCRSEVEEAARLRRTHPAAAGATTGRHGAASENLSGARLNPRLCRAESAGLRLGRPGWPELVTKHSTPTLPRYASVNACCNARANGTQPVAPTAVCCSARLSPRPLPGSTAVRRRLPEPEQPCITISSARARRAAVRSDSAERQQLATIAAAQTKAAAALKAEAEAAAAWKQAFMLFSQRRRLRARRSGCEPSKVSRRTATGLAAGPAAGGRGGLFQL